MERDRSLDARVRVFGLDVGDCGSSLQKQRINLTIDAPIVLLQDLIRHRSKPGTSPEVARRNVVDPTAHAINTRTTFRLDVGVVQTA